jgi:3-hydroxyacyl-CoA dehydrogenase / enoyl-CoA hydratase / 3-hydroxybutyryl-CoA epimerase
MSENLHGFHYHKDDEAIVTITMDLDGPVNAMNDQFRRAFTATADKLCGETKLHGVIFASAKSTFFAGGDLKEMLQCQPGGEHMFFDMVEVIKADMRRLERLPVPIVAAINGSALGGGLELCLACNYRIASNKNNTLIGLPEVTLGLLPGGGGVVRSIHLLGLQKALPLLLEGTRFRPNQALEAGYIDALVDHDDLLISSAKAWLLQNPDAWQQPWDRPNHRLPGGDVWHPSVQQTLAAAPAMLFKKTRGLLPAPERILSVAADVVTVDFDTAQRIESRAFASLVTTKEAKNLISGGFFQMNKINSGASRPRDIAPTKISKLGVLGAGMMGQGIAYCAAKVGIEVVLKDVEQAAADKGKAYSAQLMDKQIARGRAAESDKTALLDKIHATTHMADLQGCDLIVEAVFEDLALKHSILSEAEQYLADNGVLASNTSTLPISLLAEAVQKPERFIGIHFFSPVDKMPLIEIIRGERTSDDALAVAFDFSQQLRKTPIVVNDSLGFFTSRVFSTYLDEAAHMIFEGLDPLLIDNLGRHIGMPVGPLTVQDEVSQQLAARIAQTHQAMGVFCSKADTSANAALCSRMVNEFNRRGRHHGGGFFDYTEQGKTVWSGMAEHFVKAGATLTPQDIKDRLLMRQVLESLRCLEEGVLSSVADGNVGSLLGIGAPSWTGGFIQMVNTYSYGDLYGAAAVAARCDELAAQFGERFTVPNNLRHAASRGESFQ